MPRQAQAFDSKVVLDRRPSDLPQEIYPRLRLLCPDMPIGATFRACQRLGFSHEIWLLESSPQPTYRFLLKGPKLHDRVWQSLENEAHILGTVTPTISQVNSLIRTPQVLAWYPDLSVLVLELIDGPAVSSILYGLMPSFSGHNLPHLIALAAEWLAQFHHRTRTGENGRPFAWLQQQFTEDYVKVLFTALGAPDEYGRILDLLDRLSAAYSGYLTPTCTVHGDLTPCHVLSRGNAIYIIDFGSTSVGYPLQDLAFFLTYPVLLPPHRQAAAIARLLPLSLDRIFFRACEKHGLALTASDRVLLPLFRLHSLRVHAARALASASSDGNFRARVKRRWLRWQFQRACSRELSAF